MSWLSIHLRPDNVGGCRRLLPRVFLSSFRSALLSPTSAQLINFTVVIVVIVGSLLLLPYEHFYGTYFRYKLSPASLLSFPFIEVLVVAIAGVQLLWLPPFRLYASYKLNYVRKLCMHRHPL